MKILKYTPAIQEAIKSKTEARPWLHIAVNMEDKYAIYIWDTREVLEEGKANYRRVDGAPALDNMSPLKGSDVNVYGPRIGDEVRTNAGIGRVTAIVHSSDDALRNSLRRNGLPPNTANDSKYWYRVRGKGYWPVFGGGLLPPAVMHSRKD